jgi:RNA polymerase-binding transcription factor DksA
MTDQLSDKQLKGLEETLRRRLDELLDEIRDVLLRSDDEHYRALAGEVHDVEDESVADLLVDVTLAEIDRDIGEVRDIEQALMRMSSRSYGVCIDCGVAIDYKRLQAYPSAHRCRPCQEQYEKTHRDHRHDTL